MTAPAVPADEVVALVDALRQHLLNAAPGGGGGAKGNNVAPRRKRKSAKKGADADEEEVCNNLRVFLLVPRLISAIGHNQVASHMP